MAGAGYLPPVVAQILADASPFVSKLTEVQGLLENFAKQNTQTQIGASMAPFETDIASAKAQLLDFAKQVSNANLGANATPFWTDIAALRTELGAMSQFDINVGANTAAALAKIAALKEALDLAGVDSILGGGGSGGKGTEILATGGSGGSGGNGGGGSLAAGSLGFLFGRGGSSAASAALWGEVGGGFLQRLLSPLTMLTTLFSAGIGSAGEMAGFGPEHLLLTALGMGGSMAGGGVGAGLLGLGTLGTMGAGTGSDTLVSHEMISNVEALVKGTETLAQVTAKVGPAAAQAESQLAAAYKGMASAFDKATGPAQVAAAALGGQFIKLADTYIPLVAKAATTNFGIINSSLKPLFAWLEGPQGEGIFENLESIFAKNLPTAVHAFSQGLELLLKIMDDAAQHTGGFVKELNDLLTKWNSPGNSSALAGDVTKMINLFHTWAKFFEALGKTIYDIFSKSVGLGKSLAVELTSMLNHLDKYIKSSTGSATLKNVFTAHKGEIDSLLAVLPSLIKGFGSVYTVLGPAFTNAVTAILRPLGKLLDIVTSNPFGAWAVGLGMIELRTHALSTGFSFLRNLPGNIKNVANAIGSLPGKIGAAASKVATWATNVGTAIAASAKWVAKTASDAAQVAAKWATNGAQLVATWASNIASMIAKGVAWAAEQVAQVFTVVATNIVGADAVAAGWTLANIAMMAGILLIVAVVIAAVVLIVTHWKLVESTAVAVWNAIVSAAKTAVGAIGGFFVTAAGDIVSTVTTLVGDIVSFFTGVPGKVKNAITSAFADAGTWLLDAGKAIVQGLINGITGAIGSAVSAVKTLGGDIVGAAKSVLSIFSPSAVFADIGKNVSVGMAQGIMGGAAQAVSASANLASQVTKAASSGLGRGGYGTLSLAGAGGMGNVTISSPVTVQVAGTAAGTPQGIGTAVQQAINKNNQKLVSQIRAGAYLTSGRT